MGEIIEDLHLGFYRWFLGRPAIADFLGFGRPDPENRRFPAGPKTMSQKPMRKRLEVIDEIKGPGISSGAGGPALKRLDTM